MHDVCVVSRVLFLGKEVCYTQNKEQVLLEVDVSSFHLFRRSLGGWYNDVIYLFPPKKRVQNALL